MITTEEVETLEQKKAERSSSETRFGQKYQHGVNIFYLGKPSEKIADFETFAQIWVVGLKKT